MSSSPSSSRDAPWGDLSGAHASANLAASHTQSGVAPPSLSVPPGTYTAAPAPPYGAYPYPAAGQPLYYPLYGQPGLSSAPLPASNMGGGYAPQTMGVPVVGMRPGGYSLPYVPDQERRSHTAPRHDRGYNRPYAPRHAARPGPGVEEVSRASPSPARSGRGRDEPEHTPPTGQLTPHAARLQAQAPRFTPSPAVRSESSAREAPGSSPEGWMTSYVYSRLPPLPPLPPKPTPLPDEVQEHLPEEVKQYILDLESLVSSYKKREESHTLQLEALAFNPVLALRGVTKPTGAKSETEGAEGETEPRTETQTEAETHKDEDEASDPELDPAPILGLRLLHRVQELTEENEELGRLLEKRVVPGANVAGAQADPEEVEAMRADLEDAHTLLQQLDAAVAAANERTKQMEEALQSVCSANSVGIAESLAHLHLSEPNTGTNSPPVSAINPIANNSREGSSSPRPRKEDRGARSGRRMPGHRAPRGTPRSGQRSGAGAGAGTGTEGKPWKGGSK